MAGRTLASTLTLLIAAAACAQPAKGPETTPDTTSAAQPVEVKPVSPVDMAEAGMKAWAAASTPGPMHEMMKERAGTWNMKYSMMSPMDPTQTMESTGTTVSRPIFGGRFMQSEIKGTMMGQPFEGLEIMGYNNTAQQFESVWLDSMGTAMMFTTGTQDAATKVLTMTGKMDDPMTKESMPVRNVITHNADGTTTFEMFTKVETKDIKMMTVTYTRAKADAKPEPKTEVRPAEPAPGTRPDVNPRPDTKPTPPSTPAPR